MTQTTLWQHHQQNAIFAELCNALYERELAQLIKTDAKSVEALAGRLKSLPYYIKRTAHLMSRIETPLTLDSQNASWSCKQGARLPIVGQEKQKVNLWYKSTDLCLGLVIPIALDDRIVLDCIDRVDLDSLRFRSNVFGWHYLTDDKSDNTALFQQAPRLLKPTKAIMTAACTGHAWRDKHKIRPVIPTLRELLLSCQINWKNFKINGEIE